MMFTSYTIRNIPAFDHMGKHYPHSFDLAVKCDRGMRWDAGNFATRDEAVAAGIAKTGAR